MTKDPASPAMIRTMVAPTSLNIDPSEKISMQRQNTSISDGNRKRGKNSEANCQINITTTNGSTDDPTRLSAASSVIASGDNPACGAVSLICRAPDKSGGGGGGREGRRSIFPPRRPG